MQIEHFVKGKLEVCRWVGLAVLLVQLISLALAYALSAAQQRLLDVRLGSPTLLIFFPPDALVAFPTSCAWALLQFFSLGCELGS